MSKLLIVEDSPTQRESLKTLLELEGFEVVTASDGTEGFEKAHDPGIDLVITDIIMPGLSGYELCWKVKKEMERKDVPVILLTTMNDAVDFIEGLECGADNFAVKPYDRDRLLRMVRGILENGPLRAGGKASSGVEIVFLNKKYWIHSEKQQILDLLISTFEEIVRTNRRLSELQKRDSAARAEMEEYAKHMEGKFQLSEGKYRLLMEQANDSIVVLDPDGKILEVNLQAALVFGLSHDELVGRNYVELLPVSERTRINEGLRALYENKRVFVTEFYIKRPDLTKLFLESSTSLVDMDGELTAISIIRDTTERWKAVVEKTRLAAIVESSNDAILGLDTGGVVTSWNQGAERLYGYRGDEIIGRPATSLIPPEGHSQFTRMLEDCVQGLFAPPLETVHRGKAGHKVPVSMTLSHLKGDAGELAGISLIAQDITERKKTEEAFRVQEKQLHQAQKMESIGRLAGGIAHDFNNMLTVINGYAEMLLEDKGQTWSAREGLEEILKSGKRAGDLTHQLLAFSRHQVVQPRTLNLNGVILDMEQMVRRLVPENITIETIADPKLWPVNADPGQVQQVIMNMMVNAADAIENEGRIIVETKNVHLEGERTDGNQPALWGDHAMFSIGDTGAGISEAVKSQMFEPFFTTKEPGKGTGLGLATSLGIVQQAGGGITVYSELGKGTVMKVYLPRAASGEPGGAAREDPGEAVPGGNETVLLVEDEEALRDLARKILTTQGYKVLAASNGREAMKVLARSPGEDIRLILTDVVMPVMGGRILFENVREKYPDMKVLFSSGYTDNLVVRRQLLEKNTGFLPKPFTPAGLCRKVREILDQG